MRGSECLHRMTSSLGRLAALALCCALAVPCAALPIQQRLPSGLLANADFRQGGGHRAALVLHGFLATYHFRTIERIVDELADEGYTVLAPTLTLGISDRHASLPCDALQLHTMNQTVAELGWWVDWLARKGNDDITLIGHSAGSTQVLAYTADEPNPAVHRQVLISLVPLEPLPGKQPAGAGADQARAWLASGERRIDRYDLSFCHGSFTAPPSVYLSYRAWTRNRIAAALRASRIPTTVIVGGKDHRFIDNDWLATLRASAPRLVVLPNADHFFDGPSEFDLLDGIDAALQARVQGSTGQ